MRQILFNPFRRADEIDGVIVVLFDASRDCEDIWIKDDVLRRKTDLLRENPVRPLAHFDLALERIRLALFIKRHYDYGRAVAPYQACLMLELLFAFFKADRIYDAFALHAFQAGFNNRP